MLIQSEVVLFEIIKFLILSLATLFTYLNLMKS